MSPTTTVVDFGDPRGLADFATFVGRARTANPAGAVRLQVVGGLLLATVAVIEGSGLMGEGTVLGLRIARLAPGSVADDEHLDATVSFESLADRLARSSDAGTTLSVPPTTVSVPWGGLTPPRDGWEPVGKLDGAAVDSVAQQGISAVTHGTPDGAGAHAVEAVRRRVWGAMSDTVPPVAAGLAFGAHVLGFTQSGQPAAVAAHGRWTRLSTARGHVLGR